MSFRVAAARTEGSNMTVTLNDDDGNEMTTVFEGTITTTFTANSGFAMVNFHCVPRSGEETPKFLNRPRHNF